MIISLGSVTYYFDHKEKKQVLLSEKYIQAKISLENGEKNKAINILRELILSKDDTYSTLSLFLMLDENLITNENEAIILFDRLIEANNFDIELKNLLVFKKALFSSNFIDESALLETIKPLLASESLWKPHALLLIGDYFVSKGEYLKAKEFYKQILLIKNLQNDFYEQARAQLIFIHNE